MSVCTYADGHRASLLMCGSLRRDSFNVEKKKAEQTKEWVVLVFNVPQSS